MKNVCNGPFFPGPEEEPKYKIKTKIKVQMLLTVHLHIKRAQIKNPKLISPITNPNPIKPTTFSTQKKKENPRCAVPRFALDTSIATGAPAAPPMYHLTFFNQPWPRPITSV